jgi:hypothetical protein
LLQHQDVVAFLRCAVLDLLARVRDAFFGTAFTGAVLFAAEFLVATFLAAVPWLKVSFDFLPARLVTPAEGLATGFVEAAGTPDRVLFAAFPAGAFTAFIVLAFLTAVALPLSALPFALALDVFSKRASVSLNMRCLYSVSFSCDFAAA